VAIIDGVISGPIAGAAASDDAWNIVLFLAPWRHPDGRIEQQELRVEREVGSSAQLDRAMDRFTEGDAVQVTTARVAPPRRGYTWWTCAPATRIAKTRKAPDLDEAQRERERPVVVRDPELGRLVLDRDLDAFAGKRKLGARRYTLSIARALRGTPEAQVCAMRPRVIAFERGYAHILAAVVEKTLPLYNENWRDNRKRLTATAFRSRLRLQSVHIGPGRTTAYLEAGSLFLGHVVEVRLDPRTRVREVMLAG
jgi:hypothetical protein